MGFFGKLANVATGGALGAAKSLMKGNVKGAVMGAAGIPQRGKKPMRRPAPPAGGAPGPLAAGAMAWGRKLGPSMKNAPLPFGLAPKPDMGGAEGVQGGGSIGPAPSLQDAYSAPPVAPGGPGAGGADLPALASALRGGWGR
jgi:hypothetical protein